MKKIKLTWQDFDRDMDTLANRITSMKPKAIYGIPRGGLIVAVALSHRLDLPLLLAASQISPSTLVVDDVVETGRTLDLILTTFQIAVWCSKGSYYGAIFVRKFSRDEWLIMPWECTEKAEKDAAAYYENK